METLGTYLSPAVRRENRSRIELNISVAFSDSTILADENIDCLELGILEAFFCDGSKSVGKPPVQYLQMLDGL